MRKFLVIFAIALLPSLALAHGHGGGGGGGGGGHMGGWGGGHMGSWGGGHMGGRWGAHGLATTGSWHGVNWHHGAFFHHGRFVHRHHRFFFVGGPIFAASGYGYDCWSWVPTAWGPHRVWVCGDY